MWAGQRSDAAGLAGRAHLGHHEAVAATGQLDCARLLRRWAFCWGAPTPPVRPCWSYFPSILWYNAFMNYQFPPDIEERLKARMARGQYESEDDVLREAMDALDQLEQDKLARWNERNRLAVQQSQQGLSRPLDEEAVLGRLRERLAREGIVD